MLAVGLLAVLFLIIFAAGKAEPTPPEPEPEPGPEASHIAWTNLPPAAVSIGSRLEWGATITNNTDMLALYTFDGGYYMPDGTYRGKFGGFRKRLAPGQAWTENCVAIAEMRGTYIISMKSNGVELKHSVIVV